MMLNNGEKLILYGIAVIHEQLGTRGDAVDWGLVKEAIERGHHWALPQFAYEDDPDVVQETRDIMEMWFHIENSRQRLSQKDRVRVDAEASRVGRKVEFTGFAGNDEAAYLSVALFLINRLGSYGNFKGRDLNCHCPSLSMEHLPMLWTYRRLRPDFTIGEPMSADQLIEVLTALNPLDLRASDRKLAA
jgi:uncharacterized protein YfbU (UPF0304 family)